MIFQHTHEWVTGVSPHTGEPKTHTLRLAIQTHGVQLLDAKTIIWDWKQSIPFGTSLRAVIANRRNFGALYWTGALRSVQPGRGKIGVGYIQIATITLTRAADMTSELAHREGFRSVDDFLELWVKLHGEKHLETPAWGIGWEGLVK